MIRAPKQPRPELSALPETSDANPIHVWLEPTSRCNTRCTHCGHYYSRFGEDMAPELYEKIKSSVLDTVRRAELIGYGEPLMAKSFPQMFDDCVNRGIEIYTTTNGLLLRKEDLLAKIVRNNVTLCLSIDGAQAETFQFVRPLIPWPRMTETLELIKRHADEAGPEKRFRLRFNFVAMKKNIGDLPDLVRLAHRYDAREIFILPLGGEDVFELMHGQSLHDSPELVGPAFLEALRLAARYKVSIQVPPSFRGMILQGSERGIGLQGKAVELCRRALLAAFHIRKNGLLSIGRRLRRPPVPRSITGGSYCTMPWKDAYFAADGTVFPCCVMGESLGDMKQQSWAEIWNGPLYRNLRRTIHSYNPTSACRFCALPLGINGGDEKQYAKFFARFHEEPVALDSPALEFLEGFHALELTAEGRPSHRWMDRRGRFRLPMRPGAHFLRVKILPRAPVPDTNPGACRINSLPQEPFDNSCDVLHFPLDGIQDPTLDVTLEMERVHTVPPDTRTLSIPIVGVSYLVS